MSMLSFNPKLLSNEDRVLYEKMVDKRKKAGAPFGGPYDALMNHPKLCEKIEALGYYLKFDGHLPRNIYQFVVLTVAQKTQAEFEWKDHVEHAVSAGVPQEVINMLKSGASSFPDPYKLAAELLNYVFAWKSIPEPLQNACISAYGMYGLIEIVTLSGFYQLFAAVNQGFDIH